MDFIVFLVGTGLFGGGFFFLIFSLWKKRGLVFPFVLMGAGVILCFVGLILSSPLTNEEAEFGSSHAEKNLSSAIYSHSK